MSSSSASTALVDNTKRELFLQDDEELLRQLSSGHIPPQNELDDLLSRWLEDQAPSADANWPEWIGSVRRRNFVIQENSHSIPSASATNAASTPAAFQTSSGKHHVEAIRALLRFSDNQAIQLTLSALLRFESSDRLQSLLGTQELVQTVLQYHARQRLARLRSVSEVLRLEQDDNFSTTLQPILDKFDQSYYLLQKLPRSFFKILLSSAASGAAWSPSRGQVLPLQQIIGRTRQEDFVRDCWDACQDREAEREEALEATLVLVYNRTRATRLDLALIVTAFKACNYFVDEATGSGHRLSHLAGLICAASMGLCLTSGPSTGWVGDHPLLVGIADNSVGTVAELETLVLVLFEDARKAAGRRQTQLRYLKNSAESEVVVDAPEAVGLLGLGLLMRSSLLNILGSKANDCIEFASEECGVFGYVRSTLKALLISPTKSLSVYKEQVCYDWQLDVEAPVLAVEVASRVDELQATQIAYASIGLEIVSSTVTAFSDIILRSPENLVLMADLATVVYANQPMLCEQFWREFELYSQLSLVDPVQVINPVCQLLDSAYQLARATEGSSEEACIPSVAPLLQLVSSMCSNPEMVRDIVTSMPPTLFQTALELCAPTTHVANKSAYIKNVRSVAESMYSLAMIGDSKILREAIGEQGPNLIYNILSFHDDHEVLSSAIRLLAGLADDAHWLLQTMKVFGADGVKRLMTSPSCVASSAELLTVLTKNMDSIVFKAGEIEGNGYMEAVLVSVLGACEVLSMAVASPRFEFSCAHNILHAVKVFLSSIRHIVVMHPAESVRTSAATTRDALVQSLATSTSLGQALAHFCCAPVSMSLAIALEEDLYEANVQKHASEEYAVDDAANKYGAWRTVVQVSSKTADKAAKSSNAFSRVKARFVKRLSNRNGLSADLEGMRQRGWVKSNQENAVVHASASALSVLKIWGLCLEDVIRERDLNPTGDNLEPEGVSYIQTLSPFRIVTSLAVAPPVVREASALLLVWPTEEVSVLDLLIKIVDLEGLPVFEAMDVIQMTLDHAGYAGGQVPAIHRVVHDEGLLSRVVDDLLSFDTKKVRFKLAAIRLLSSLTTSGQLEYQMFSKKESRIVSALTDCLDKVVQSTKQLGDSYLGKLSHDQELISDLRVATNALAFLELTEREYRDKSPGLFATRLSATTASGSLLSSLIMMVSTLPQMRPVHVKSPLVSHCSRTLRLLLSSALNILSYNLAKAQGNKREAIVNELKQNDRLSKITETAFFVELEIPSLNGAFSALQAKGMSTLAEAKPSSLLALFPAQSVGEAMLDIPAAATWLSNVSGSQNDTGLLLVDLDVCTSMLASQMRLSGSWAQFLQVARHFGAIDSKGGTKPISLIRNVIVDIVGSYGKVNALIQKALYSDIMRSFNDLLIFLLQSVHGSGALDSSTVKSWLLETFDSVLAIGEEIMKMSRVKSLQPLSLKLVEKSCGAQEKVLSCAAFLLDELDESHFRFSVQDKQDIERCLLKAMSIVGDGLQDVGQPLVEETSRASAQRYVEVACIVLMATVTRLKDDPDGLTNLTRSMAGANVVELLAQHGIAASKLDSISSKGKSGERKSIKLLKGIVAFFTVLSQSIVHCPGLLSVLSSGRLSQLVVHNPLVQADTASWSSLDNMRYRGYVRCTMKRDVSTRVGGGGGESSSQFMNGEDDPMHQLWIDIVNLHATLLQSMESLSVQPDTLKDLVFDFVETYSASLLQSLNHCDAATTADYSMGTVLTKNVLKEVSSVLSLVSTLYSPSYRVTFEGTHETLSRRFKERSMSVIGSLSKYLGASGSARELFRLVSAIDHLMNRDDEDFRLSPTAHLDIHAAFSSGLPTARHQAIANAHLATRCYGLVSEKEKEASSHSTSVVPGPDQASQALLEQNCQLILSSKFSRAMEHSAALCLVNAIRVLWRTRPTSACFTMLSEDEARVVDCITLVQPGMIVALRPEAADFGEDNDVEPVRFARVLKVDTVRRVWNVQFLLSFRDDGAEEEMIVSMDQLAGLEDTTVKKPILRFAPAPDSARELEESRNSTCVGDLITALRWCHQYDADGSKADKTVRECLAQAAASLLGEELALHKELKADDRDQSGETSNHIHRQLLQLFDERSRNTEDGFTRKVSKDRTNSMKKLLGTTMWEAVQQQLRGRLVDAKLEQAKRAEERRASQQKGMARRTSSF